MLCTDVKYSLYCIEMHYQQVLVKFTKRRKYLYQRNSKYNLAIKLEKIKWLLKTYIIFNKEIYLSWSKNTKYLSIDYFNPLPTFEAILIVKISCSKIDYTNCCCFGTAIVVLNVLPTILYLHSFVHLWGYISCIITYHV